MTITVSMPLAKTLITMPVLRTFDLYGFTFGAHYSVRGAEYTVSEMTTGAAVAHGDSLTGAIRTAREALEEAGEVRVCRLVDRACSPPSFRSFRAVAVDLMDPLPVIVDGVRYEPLLRLRAGDIHDADTLRLVWYAYRITARRVGARKLTLLYEDADGVMHRERPSEITYLQPRKEVSA